MGKARALEELAEELDRYRQRWPSEAEVCALFADLLREESDADPFTRERLAGHLTASSWLVDRSGRRILLTHHRKLDRWLQLGGHADGNRHLAQVALREAEEESGLYDLTVEAELFDLDRHWIPQRGEVPGHWHYDARYVVQAGGNEDYVVSDESHDLAWREIVAVAKDESLDPSLRRMAQKWLVRAG
jgi:8-oxo-dGTP pyrophosphatase MutT (NUDIX family)